MQLIPARLTAMQSQTDDLQVVVTSPKDSPSKIKGSSHCHSAQQLWSLAPPPKCRIIQSVVLSSSSEKASPATVLVVPAMAAPQYETLVTIEDWEQ